MTSQTLTGCRLEASVVFATAVSAIEILSITSATAISGTLGLN